MCVAYPIDPQKLKIFTCKKLWTLSELANNANLSQATISSLCAGRRNASLRTVYKLARALEVEPAELIKH